MHYTQPDCCFSSFGSCTQRNILWYFLSFHHCVCVSRSRTGTLLYTRRLSRATPTSSTCCFSTGPRPTSSPWSVHQHTDTHTQMQTELKLDEILNALCVPPANNSLLVCHWSEWEHCPIHRLSPWIHLCGGHSEAHDRWQPNCHGEALSSCQHVIYSS